MAEQLSEGPGNGGIAKSAIGKQGVKRKLEPKTLETKYNAIIECEKGQKSKTEISKMFDVPKNTLSGWLKKSEQIKEGFAKFGPKRRNMRTGNYEELESALLTWFTQVRDRDIPVSGPLLLQKAGFFAEQLGIDDFKQSTGWLDRFKDRNNITFKTVSGEAKSVDLDEVDKWSVTLKSVLSRYEARDIYNADETGLFFKLTPDKTLEFKNVKCVGGKRSKERITVMVCANMTGDDKIEMFVIGKSKNPRCFKNIKTLPCQYDYNSKAWMTGDIFSKWLLQLDKQFHIQKRKIAMIVDNCPAHPKVIMGLRNVELVFLAPNTTSVTQPMDQGVIKNLKVKYRKMIIQKQIRSVDNNTDFTVTVLDALRFLRQAWSQVKPETIANCFHHAGFKNDTDPAPAPVVDDDDYDDDVPIATLVELNKIQQSEMDSYINIDLDIPVCAEVTDSDIVNDLIMSRNSEINELEIDDDEPAPTPPLSLSEAVKVCEQLSHFFECQDNSNQELTHLCAVYKSLSKLEFKKRSAVQSSIKDFFKK